MAKDGIANQIESLIRKCDWKQLRALIEKQLGKEPGDHWLWSRLSGAKYEQRDYLGALEAAEKALAIISDCPLALWSKAGAVEMLGKTDEARNLYARLFRRGLQQLKNPDADANECWEGPDWTSGLMADCMFRIAGCLAKTGQRDQAIEMYGRFLSQGDLGTQSIYSREDALDRLKKLVPSKKAKREAAVKMMEKELIPAQ
jgi:tetratricopeptide (TPR) repeat protein